MKILAALVVVSALVSADKVRTTTTSQAFRPPVAQRVAPASSLRVGILRNGSYDVVTLPLETYVARVVAGEAAAASDPAALEAMAVTVRTFALANRGRHRADGFDLCDQTHCQVVRAATSATARAALATNGQVLLHDGAPASVYYSASCGGRTERPSEVWPGADDPSYLPSRHDDACGGEPAWTANLASVDLQRALRAAGFRGTLRSIAVASRSKSGRVARLSLTGLTPSAISGQDLRMAVGRTLGWQYLRSTAFDMRQTAGAYRFAGHGSGHGVGMCVIGATRLAAAGQSAAAILERYFPGLEIGSVGPRLTAAPPSRPDIAPPPTARSAPAPPNVAPAPNAATIANPVNSARIDVLVSLPDEDEGEGPMIRSLVVRARDNLVKTLGISAPPSITLRFHATTSDYERATGQAWFTSAAVVNAEAHFVPLASLRDRGVLDRTIRRELVHVMVDSTLDRRPVWVREGAALIFSDAIAENASVTDKRASGSRLSCPSEGELERPVSAGALSDAYARARACVARQLAAGRSWRDVR